jgi:hypothetical protein
VAVPCAHCPHLRPFLSTSTVLAHTPYVIGYILAVMGRGGLLRRSIEFGRGSVLRRLEAGANRKDLFYYLVRQDTGSGTLTSLGPITEWRGPPRSRASLYRRHCTKWDTGYYCRFGHNEHRPHGHHLLPVTQSGRI